MKRWMLLGAVFLVGAVFSQTAYAQSTVPTAIKQRAEERKTRLKIRLTTAETTRVTARCVAAQQKLAVFSNKGLQNNQTKYQSFIDRIEKLEQNLSTNGVKSSELLNEISVAKQKYEALNTAVSSLNQAVQDTKELDCKQDPVAFKAALEDARALAKTAHDAQADFINYVAQTIKPTLQSLKDKKS